MPSTSPEAIARHRATAKARAHENLGRVCCTCFINDSECLWSTVDDLCRACKRRSYPRKHLKSTTPGCGRCRCGMVMRRTEGSALCASCDWKKWEALGYVRTYLVSPTDDRERILWRKAPKNSPSVRYPLALVATAEQWRTER